MPTSQGSDDFSKIAVAVAAVGVVIGFFSMPYGYYQLLRLTLCGISLYFLFGGKVQLVDWQRWTLGASAVLYNPVLPIRLGDKGLWTVLNVLTLVLFWAVRFRSSRR